VLADGLHVYETQASTPEHTAASFVVEHLQALMSDLRGKGVSFEEYTCPA
jgi:hypothetical protein